MNIENDIDFSEVVADRYRIVSLLGHGGMGAVYKVEQIFLKQTFALKTLTAKNFSDTALRRFQKEAQAAGKLTHPNLVRAVDFGVLKNGNPFYIMDLVEGDNLAEYTKKIGLLKLDEVFKIFIPICFALGYAHTEGVIHRDIKPGNIMLARTGNPTDPFVPKIVDFGIAKLTESEEGAAGNLTQTGEVFGTPLYMSPEQCFGKSLDKRSDIYSLGCVLYESLTGAPPFTGETALALMMKHQSEEPASLKEASLGRIYPDNLEKIVRRTLAKDPNHRYQRLEDLASDLATVQLDSNANIASGPKTTLGVMVGRSDEKQSAKTQISKMQAVAWGVAIFLLGFGFKWSIETPRVVEDTDEKNEKLYHTMYKLGTLEYAVDKPNRHYKLYDFPPQFKDCMFSYIDKNGKRSENHANGRFEVPDTSDTWMMIPQVVLLSYPYMLRGFRRNDLHSLHLGEVGDLVWITENGEGIYDVALAYASRMTGLHEIIAYGTTLSDVGIRCIEDLPNLYSLDVSYSPVTAAALGRLKNFDKLQTLGMNSVRQGKDLMPRIVANKLISSLSLENLDLNDADVQKLKDSKYLNFLTLQENPKITNEALEEGFTSLERLRFAGTQISPKIIPNLLRIPKLRQVIVGADLWKPSDMESLKKLSAWRIEVIVMSRGKDGKLSKSNPGK